MGKMKRTRKFAVAKKQLKASAVPAAQVVERRRQQERREREQRLTHVDPVPTSLFFNYNTSLGPPYTVLVDTNMLNQSIRNKLDPWRAAMDCLLAKATLCITDCVMGELEKLGSKYRLALRMAKDRRFHRLTCTHKGTYADDCIVNRITQHRCYIVATCDRDLKRRVRKVPGVPIMSVSQRRYEVERMPDSFSK